jgi:hypothetical protein
MTTALFLVIGIVCLYLAIRWGMAWLLRKKRAK